MNKKWIAAIVIFLLLITAVVIAAVIQDNSKEALTFAEFLEMTPAEQQAYMESYDDIMDFLEWYRKAEEKYKAEQPNVEIGGNGDIDIGDYID